MLIKDIIVLILGSDYHGAAFILPFLIFGPVMYTISETTVIGINFMNKSKTHMTISLIVFIIDIIANLLFVPIFGTRGAAFSTGVSYILFFFLRTYYSQKYYSIEYNIKPIVVLTILFFVYALYNTFNQLDIVSIILYLLIIFTMLYFYKSTIKTLFRKIL